MTLPAVPAQEAVGFRLSPQQRHLWRHGLARGRAVALLELSGGVQADAVERTVAALVERYEILRTDFVQPAGLGTPVQLVAPAARPQLERREAVGLGDGGAEALLAAEVAADGAAGLRAVLLAPGADGADGRRHLLLSVPALAADRPTFQILAALLAEGCAAGGTLPEADPLQYADFAEWQSTLLESEEDAESRRFWQEVRCSGLRDAELPFAAVPRPDEPFVPRRRPVDLPPATREALAALATEHGGGLADALLALWQLVLQRFAGGEAPQVGRTWDGRRYEELADLAGPAERTVPVPLVAAPEVPFAEAVARAVSAGATALEFHEVFGWEERIEAGELTGAQAYLPFQLDEAGGEPEHRAGGVTVRLLATACPEDRFVWKLRVRPATAGAAVELLWDSGLAGDAEAAVLAGALAAAAEALATDPQRPFAAAPVTAPALRRRLLEEWHGETRDVAPRCLHELFAETAQAHADRPALAWDGEEISFAELARRAHRLAHRLRRAGIGPEQVVAVALPRGPDLVAAVLAVLEAGGAYMAVDPELPPGRLAHLFAIGRPRVLLTTAELAGRLPAAHGALRALEVIVLEREDLAALPETAPESATVPENLAYLVFTSGSTGVPKGVAAHHRGAVSYLAFVREEYGLGPGDRVLQLPSLSFDASVRDLLGPLLAGATVVLVEDEAARDPEALVERLERHRVTRILSVVPSLLRQLVAAASPPRPERFAALTTVLASGERLFLDDARRARAAFGEGLVVVNQYGPTECTMTSSFHRVPAGATGGATARLGRPIHNARFYVVDAAGEPAPPGIAGELLIGGPGLARGYRGRPAATAAAFVPDPFASAPGARVYRTGDLVRWSAGGELEFLGRRDDQVKVRGFRVEPAEVEAALLAHDGVREAAVVAREDEPGEVRLAAYWVAAPEPGDGGASLRAFLERQLPAYLVPAVLMELPELPRTPNGKVDRRALPEPVETGGAGYVAPRTVSEEILCALWADVLGVERVGAEDDFFALGGHSLLATQVVARARKVFQVELGLQAVFEWPRLDELAAVIDEAMRGPGAGGEPALEPVPREGSLPLSFAQQRLWFLHRLEPESAAYNLPTPVGVRGPLRPAALADALGEVVRRHEALRTTFHETDGEPVQRIEPPAMLHLPTADLSRLAPERRDAEVRRLAVEEARRPFDLSRGPLLRARLLRLEPERWVLLFTMHHIVSDVWSAGVLVSEVALAYRALAEGRPASLPELPVQYADFAAWQRRWLGSAALEEHLDYWRRQLDGMPAQVELPSDRPRPAVPSGRGGKRLIRLPASLGERLQGVVRSEGVTLFMVLLAAFKTLLHRYTAQTDVAVGTAMAGRHRVEVEPLIGFFINTLVLRTSLAGDPTFRELLVRARQILVGAYAHQDLPFDRLVEELEPERDLVRAPLVQGMVGLQTVPHGGEAAPEIPGLRFERLDLDPGTARFEFDFLLWTTPSGGLGGLFEYSSDLFDATTVARLLQHFAVLLEGAAADPGARLSALPLLRPAERHQLLAEWNGAAAAREDGTAAALFARQAAATPEAPAATCGAERVTYGELATRVERLAAGLLADGAGREEVVAVAGERGIDLLASLLGVLAAGAAYLPLDPHQPAARLAQVLAQAGVRRVLDLRRPGSGVGDGAGGTEAGAELVAAVESLPPADRPRRLALADLAAAGAERLAAGFTLPPAPGGSRLAYVLFTSGSTGVPKGAMVEHRGMVNHLAAKVGELGLGAGDVVAQTASQTFDISVWQFLAALTVGGRVAIFADEVTHDPRRLLDEVAASGVTVLQTVPSLLAVLLESVERGAEPAPPLPALRWLVPTGEALPPELVRRWLAAYPAVPMVNAYGPTECSDDVTHQVLRAAPPPEAASVPIGRPLPGLRLHVLDRSWRTVPVGAAGELFVGGVGVGRGYLGEPARTAEVFVPDPFAGESGARLYRTGDRARVRPDGALEFLGRLDHQVKVRGFRIELGEVEAALAAHPAVAAAAVAVAGEGAGPQSLVAYVAVAGGRAGGGAGGEAADGAADEALLDGLEAHLRSRLPEYMLPSRWVLLDELPRTATGKVDRRALAGLGAGRARESAAGGPPATPAEELLATVWRDVLGVESPGREDHFFRAGGHSLLATRLISRLRETFGVELPLRAVFEAPTLAALARRVEAERAEGALPQAPPVLPRRGDGPLPLSFGQQRLWFLSRLDPDDPTYNVPAVVELAGRLDAGALAAAFTEVVRRHEVLRTVFRDEGGTPYQVVLPAGPVPLPQVDLAALPEVRREGEARSLAERAALLPFDLARGPMLRCRLLRLGPERHLLAVEMHHIASDGWSVDLLIRELAALYAAAAAGEPSPLPELPIQYGDYAAWQREWLRGAVLDEQLAYWRRQLGDLPPLLALPTDRPRPAVLGSRGSRRALALPAALAPQVAALAEREGVTPFMVLLAAWMALLHRSSGQEAFAVGTPVAGRTRVETEGLIGFLVNTLALRADLAGEPTFREQLARVRDVAVDAHTHQDVPFERLVDELQPQRSLSHTPIFQAVFVYQEGGDAAPVELPDLALRPVPLPTRTAKFDLILSLVQGGDALTGALLFNTELFGEATIERLGRQYATLLSGAVAAPETAVATLPLLDAAERAEVLAAACRRRDAGAPVPLPQRFAEHARRAPDAVAVTCGGHHLSYGELERRSAAVAARLAAAGAGVETVVGLCCPPSPELVVGVLGIQRAGGAYLPLDPGLPPERLALLLADAAAPVVAAARSAAGRLPAEVPRVLLEEAAAGPAAFAALAVPPPDATAYVIYTSGSTGRPKGVPVSHAAAARLFDATDDWFGFGPGDVWTLFHSFAFDFSVWELWGALAHGGRLVVVPREVARSPQDFGELVRGERVTVLNQTPSAFRQLSRTLLAAGPGSGSSGGSGTALREIVFGGEALEVEALRPWFERHGDRRPRLVNMYGITETTVHVTYRPLAAADLDAPGVSPLGEPIPDLELHVLDPALEPVPVGVPGELYVAGAGLARGYLGRPGLAAGRFLPHPFSAHPGDRLYRTGDLARRLPGGEIAYLGRGDQQVKVRGFRIELGEIEAALARCPEIDEAAVVARDTAGGDRELVAYAVGSGAGDEVALRARLARELPEYMVPARVVELAELPLTRNGKLDRARLPRPEGAPRAAAGERVPPSGALERRLLAALAEVVERPEAGVTDSFFDLGGDSLKAVRFANRASAALGADVRVKDVFRSPSVRELAAALAAAAPELAGREDAASGAAAIPRAERPAGGALPLSSAQERLWVLERLDPGTPTFHIAGGIELAGPLEPAALSAALAEVVRRHEALRTGFHDTPDGPVQRVRDVALGPLPVVDLGALPAAGRRDELARIAWQQEARPFDLAAPPLLRACLVRLGAEEHAVLYTLHHLVGDGWSMGVIAREVGRLYAAAAEGLPSPLPELAIQYPDYAAWQRRWLDGPEAAEQAAWWRRRLEGELPPVVLPSERRAGHDGGDAGWVEVRVPEDLARRAEELARDAGTTRFGVLLAAFDALVHLATGLDDVVIGTNVANRGRAGAEELIGFFVNNLLVRADLGGAPTLREVAARVGTALREGLEHQDLPYEALLREIRPQRYGSPVALFQVLFVSQDFPGEERPLPGLTARPLVPRRRRANFPFTVNVGQAAGGGLALTLLYDRGRHDDALVERLGRDYLAVLERLVGEPDLPLAALDLEALHREGTAADRLSASFSEEL